MGQSPTQNLLTSPPPKLDALDRRCYEELIPDRLEVLRRFALLSDPDDSLVVADHRAWPSAIFTASIIARSSISWLVAFGCCQYAVRMMTAAQPPFPVWPTREPPPAT